MRLAQQRINERRQQRQRQHRHHPRNRAVVRLQPVEALLEDVGVTLEGGVEGIAAAQGPGLFQQQCQRQREEFHKKLFIIKYL